MLADILLVLGGHESSLFPNHDGTLNRDLVQLLHPGEKDCLETLGRLAFRFRTVKKNAQDIQLAKTSSRYVCATCAALLTVLKDYEDLVVETEEKVLRRDDTVLPDQSNYLPLSSLKAVFVKWDAPLVVLEHLTTKLSIETWELGPLIDFLLERSQTGFDLVGSIFSRLALAVQLVWRVQLIAFLVHGKLSAEDPLASPQDHLLLKSSVPACISAQSRESISYIGRALATVRLASPHKQPPREMGVAHAESLRTVLPQDRHSFDRVISRIRTEVSEWLWLNILTKEAVDTAVVSLADYFLMRNGEFSLALVGEIDRLKFSRLTGRSKGSTLIREQDVHVAMLRASLGTTAQTDTSLTKLRFTMPAGPQRALLPSIMASSMDPGMSMLQTAVSFHDFLLGTPLILTYQLVWPLDLFLQPADLETYSALFSYLTSLRKTHTHVLECWSSLSGAQRLRRKWTNLGEGGTDDLEARHALLRRGWAVVREMLWFLDTFLGYVMTDVIDVQFRQLKGRLGGNSVGGKTESSQNTEWANVLDFTSLRAMHTGYLVGILTGTLLSNAALASLLRSIFEICERFSGMVERWGGDVLPPLLAEGSVANSEGEAVGGLVAERQEMINEIKESFEAHFEAFHEQVSLQVNPVLNTDGSKSQAVINSTLGGSAFLHSMLRGASRIGQLGHKSFEDNEQRCLERLLLRLDFGAEFATLREKRDPDRSILRAME
ncbi:hypothetical protein SISSUDRAFT_976958 [Sistotremastrum suecicum HHB10207 ss-3]|uniref:Spindle pole body component n=1 Tax=Sistotremastrum suecicum HHB10207 ss-3 TaxID=1314776 RepID=A0A166J7K6_9AGAM|nr:hypothetical protein SISSUDRAFT_976958 [Sistotremastrum suecicum HHB10207 ss-3]